MRISRSSDQGQSHRTKKARVSCWRVVCGLPSTERQLVALQVCKNPVLICPSPTAVRELGACGNAVGHVAEDARPRHALRVVCYEIGCQRACRPCYHSCQPSHTRDAIVSHCAQLCPSPELRRYRLRTYQINSMRWPPCWWHVRRQNISDPFLWQQRGRGTVTGAVLDRIFIFVVSNPYQYGRC